MGGQLPQIARCTRELLQGVGTGPGAVVRFRSGWRRYASCLAGMTSNLENFPPEVPAKPVSPVEDWKGFRASCRCGMPLGPDHVDEYGYRIATPLSAVCRCVIAQRVIDA